MRREYFTMKYNMPVPRYTSYPTVPNWSDTVPSEKIWLAELNKNIVEDNEISLYIHLPYCEQLRTYWASSKRITQNHSVESKYIDTLLKEWSIYLNNLKAKPIIKELHLGGGTPTFFSPGELQRLIRGITQHIMVADQPIFSFEAHPNSTSVEHLIILSELGFNRMSVGVQDIEEFILASINRRQTTKQVTELTVEARRLGFSSINYDIIYGLPFQKEWNIKQMIAFIEELLPDRLAFYRYAHVPWKSKEQRAFGDRDVPDGDEKMKLKEIGEWLLNQIGYKSIGMDHFHHTSDSLYQSYTSGQLHRNFICFTEAKTRCLIGLGCSAISDCHDVYIQNAKVVEHYQEGIQNDHLAIIKGHRLNRNEQLIRRQILSFMCNDKTQWSPDSLDETILIPAINRLAEKINDQLIQIDKNYIMVTPKVRRYRRNICTNIDPYFQSHKSLTFSKAI